MKTRIRNAAMVATMLLAGASFAQDKPAGSPPPRQAVEQKLANLNMDVPMLVKELNLDQDQVAKLKEIEAKTENQAAELKGLDKDEMTMRANEILTERNKRVAEVLTPEQVAKWQELQEAAPAAAPVMEEETE